MKCVASFWEQSRAYVVLSHRRKQLTVGTLSHLLAQLPKAKEPTPGCSDVSHTFLPTETLTD